MGVPDNMGYLPDGPVEMAFTWLKAALDCKNFHWDGDQHECASHSLEDARKYQARVLASLADAQAEIARMRGALSALELSANTVARCYTHRPENFASALQSLESDASAARELLK